MRYETDENCPPRDRARGRLLLVAVSMVLSAWLAWHETHAAVTTATHTSYALRPCSTCKEIRHETREACEEAAQAEARRVGATRETGAAVYTCVIRHNVIATFRPNPTTPPPQPCATVSPRQQFCPAGTTGTWTQNPIVSPAPACTVTWTPSAPPATACVLIPPPDPDPVPGGITLSWTAPTENDDGSRLTNLAGYRISYGTQGGTRPTTVQVGPNVTRHTLTGLGSGSWFFSVKAFNTEGRESAASNVVERVVR